MKEQNGITLIALIITIIVMLILVGVTINVALNGGIFNKAKDAQEKTKREVLREEIISTMVAAYDRTGNFIVGNVELPDDVQWCSESATEFNPGGTGITPSDTEGNWVITKDNNKFYITTDGTVLDKKPVTPDFNTDSDSDPETAPDQSIVPDIAAHYNEMVEIGDSNIRKAGGGSYGDSWKRINGDLHTYYILTVEDASKGIPLIYDNKLVVADFENQQVISFEDSGIESSFGITATQIQTELNSILNPGT